jgi:hypothetical protein
MQKLNSGSKGNVFDALIEIQDAYMEKMSDPMRTYHDAIKAINDVSSRLFVRRLNTGDFKEWIVVGLYNKSNSQKLLARRFVSQLGDPESVEIIEDIIGRKIDPDILKEANKLKPKKLKSKKSKSYDAILANGKTVEIKTVIDANSPSSFTPDDPSDTICSHFNGDTVSIYEIIPSDKIKNVRVNKNESFSDQQEKGRRPRIKIPDLLTQTGNDFSKPQYVMEISEII